MFFFFSVILRSDENDQKIVTQYEVQVEHTIVSERYSTDYIRVASIYYPLIIFT